MPIDMKRYMKDRRTTFRVKAIQELGGRCVQCGSVENLEFDHIDPKTKVSTIADALANGWGWKRLLSELEKCQLLCKSHHIEKTSNEQRGRMAWNKGMTRQAHGSSYGYDSQKCRCDPCRQWKKRYRKKEVDTIGRPLSIPV